MSLEQKLVNYAKLIVASGLNVQKGQTVVIDAAIEAASLVRLVTKEAYAIGAKEVVVKYSDEVVNRLKYENCEQEVFETIPPWLVAFKNDYANINACFLSIISSDPESLKGIDPLKMAAWSKNMNKECKMFRDLLDNATNSWCIVAASSPKWANKVFPDMSDSEAEEALWNAILKATKADLEDPIDAWQKHRESFERRVKYLNELNIDTLTYTNSLGTNIKVSLMDNYLFAGGGSYLQNGLYNFPNIPTEEIFASPVYDKTEGIVYSALPLNYNGNIIDEFFMEFKEGRIINYGAKVGYDILKEMIELDEGSHYLGEVALVPYDSPISNMNIIFYNTLFDENAVCHFAIGKGFSECIKDGLEMNKEQLKEKGINDSLLHVDFMIGTSDLTIVATTKDGKEVNIFEAGNFVF